MGEETRIEIIKTTGDKVLDVALSKAGGKGLFTKELEDALLEGSVDIAVHSLKDMPTEQPAGLILAATPERQDVRDAVVGKPLAELPMGARVGTSSLRRAAQLRALRPDIQILDIRGNLDTRLRKLDEGQYDAILLAAAGLRRLGWEDRIAELIPVEFMCPAAGQGSLAIEVKEDNTHARSVVETLNHPATHAAVTAERALLASMGGGCQVPIGAHAVVEGSSLHLRAVIASQDGTKLVRGERRGESANADAIGRALGDQLLQSGAAEILSSVYGA